MVPAENPLGHAGALASDALASDALASEAMAREALARRITALRAELAHVERALAAVAPPVKARPRLRWLRGGRWPGR